LPQPSGEAHHLAHIWGRSDPSIDFKIFTAYDDLRSYAGQYYKLFKTMKKIRVIASRAKEDDGPAERLLMCASTPNIAIMRLLHLRSLLWLVMLMLLMLLLMLLLLLPPLVLFGCLRQSHVGATSLIAGGCGPSRPLLPPRSSFYSLIRIKSRAW